jgi:hypothetical protein
MVSCGSHSSQAPAATAMSTSNRVVAPVER